MTPRLKIIKGTVVVTETVEVWVPVETSEDDAYRALRRVADPFGRVIHGGNWRIENIETILPPDDLPKPR